MGKELIILFQCHCQITVSGIQVASRINATEEVSSGSPLVLYVLVTAFTAEGGNDIPLFFSIIVKDPKH